MTDRPGKKIQTMNAKCKTIKENKKRKQATRIENRESNVKMG